MFNEPKYPLQTFLLDYINSRKLSYLCDTATATSKWISYSLSSLHGFVESTLTIAQSPSSTLSLSYIPGRILSAWFPVLSSVNELPLPIVQRAQTVTLRRNMRGCDPLERSAVQQNLVVEPKAYCNQLHNFIRSTCTEPLPRWLVFRMNGTE